MKHGSQGFTLIELICVLILIGVIGSGLLIGFTYVVNQQQSLRRDYQQVQKSQLAIMLLLSELKCCTAFTATSNTISYTNDGQKTISLKNNNIIMTTSSGEHILTNGITAFNTSLSNKLLTIQFTTLYSNDVSKVNTIMVVIP